MSQDADAGDGVTVVGPVAFAGVMLGPIFVIIGAVGGWLLSGWPAALSWIVLAIGVIWATIGALKLLAAWRLYRFLKNALPSGRRPGPPAG